MDVSRLHLLLNHYPVFGMVIGVILLALATWRGSDRVKRLSLKVFVAVAVIALPVFVSGEISGSSMARDNSGVHAEALNIHKNTARTSFLVIEATGITALLGLLALRRKMTSARWIVPAVLVLAIVGSILAGYTTLLGRQVKWAGLALNIDRPPEQYVDITVSDRKYDRMENKLWHA